MQTQAQAGRKAEVETSIQGEYSQRPTGVRNPTSKRPQSSTLPRYSYPCSCGTEHRAELLFGFIAQIRKVTVEAALFFPPCGDKELQEEGTAMERPKT